MNFTPLFPTAAQIYQSSASFFKRNNVDSRASLLQEGTLMEFFIDTANLDEIRMAKELGLLDGVTTNPSLIAQTGKPQVPLIKEICDICEGPVSFEVLATDYNGMMNQAREIAKIAENIVVKIPLTLDGLRAVSTCADEEIETNVTLCFNANQALLAAKAGASYISPFIGRLDDIGQEGLKVISEIDEIYDNYEYETRILAASVRHPLHLKELAQVGVDVATIPFSVLKKLVHHPLTTIGLENFLRDAQKIPK